MCFRPPTIETKKVCPECGFENMIESEGATEGPDFCQQCGAELPMSELDKLSAQLYGAGGVPAAPGAPKAPGAPAAPSAPKAPTA